MAIARRYLIDICLVGQGANCCKYIGLTPRGMECQKLTPMKTAIDKQVKMSAQGDNCKGLDHTKGEHGETKKTQIHSVPTKG